MPDYLPDDKLFAELMKKSCLQMPFSDFEDTVMRRIEERAKAKAYVLKNIHLAFIFFLTGTGLGIVASLFLPQLLGYFLDGASTEGISLVFQAIVVLIAITQLDRLLRLVRKQKSL